MARRLQADLRTLLLALPLHARTASGLARHLGADRTTCHRLVSAASAEDAGLPLLTLFPGVRGLRQAAAAARVVGVAEDAVARVEEAIDGFDRLIRELAGSQSRLAGRIVATGLVGQSPGVPRDELPREQLFRAAAAVVGRHCAADLFLYICRPAGNGRTLTTLVRAVLGHERSDDAVAIQGLPPFGRDGSVPSGPEPSRPQILDEFSTPAGSGSSGDPTDHAALWPVFRPAPAVNATPVHQFCAIADLPSRHLLMDVYLPRPLARLSVPSVSAGMHPPHAAAVGDPSAGRFPGTPRLELLSDLEQAAIALAPRHAELTAHAFERLACDPEEFVGYRCAVAYPIWRAAYCIGFDVSGPAR